MLRRHARRAVAVLELGGLVDRDARPDQVLLLAGDPRRRQCGQLRAQILPVPLVGAQQALHPAPALMACRFGERPAVCLGPRCQRCHVIQRHAGASLLRQYPAQERPDLGVCPRFALRDVIYAGHRGRVAVVCFHKTADAARPPRITPLQLSAQPVRPSLNVTRHHGRLATQPIRTAAQSETATVILGGAVPSRDGAACRLWVW